MSPKGGALARWWLVNRDDRAHVGHGAPIVLPLDASERVQYEGEIEITGIGTLRNPVVAAEP